MVCKVFDLFVLSLVCETRHQVFGCSHPRQMLDIVELGSYAVLAICRFKGFAVLLYGSSQIIMGNSFASIDGQKKIQDNAQLQKRLDGQLQCILPC